MKAILVGPTSGITPLNYKQCISEKAILCDNINDVKQIAYDKDDLWILQPECGVTYQDLINLPDNAVIFCNDIKAIRIL